MGKVEDLLTMVAADQKEKLNQQIAKNNVPPAPNQP